jgi:hypothetical protein
MFAHKHPSYSHMEGSDFPIYKTSPHVKTDGGQFHKDKKNSSDIHNCSHIISTRMQAVN